MHASNHPDYNVWASMKYRCYVPRCNSYRWYGAKGVQVCERWRNDFWAFIADMGPRPSKSHSIDRIDPNGHYEPGNCRWLTRVQNNLHRDKLLTHDGTALKVQKKPRPSRAKSRYLWHVKGWPFKTKKTRARVEKAPEIPKEAAPPKERRQMGSPKHSTGINPLSIPYI